MLKKVLLMINNLKFNYYIFYYYAYLNYKVILINNIYFYYKYKLIVNLINLYNFKVKLIIFFYNKGQQLL